MNSAEDLVPFPLYHGTSTHFLRHFKPGTTPGLWPHKASALELLERSWTELSKHRHEIPRELSDELLWDVSVEEVPWLVKGVIDQRTGTSNWQHGELYLTPSLKTAVNYAQKGAEHGGELLTFCKEAINALAKVDQEKADEILLTFRSLSVFLRGSKLPPFIVEFDSIPVDNLSTETQGQDVRQLLASLADESLRKVLGSDQDVREILGQQVNFRLAPGCGTVSRVCEVHVAESGIPVRQYSLHEILTSEDWGRV